MVTINTYVNDNAHNNYLKYKSKSDIDDVSSKQSSTKVNSKLYHPIRSFG